MLAFSAVSASAAYACNGNVCWVVKEKYTYPSDSKVTVHEGHMETRSQHYHP
jgi:hypothetical protein